MTSLSQRLLHTSLPHRLYTQLGVRSFSVSSANFNQNPTPSDLAHQARLLIQDAPEAVVEPERKFQANQIYPPHSFSPSSLNPPSTPKARQPLLGPPNKIAKQIDPFHASQSDPLDHIFNPAMSRAFVNQMGRIRTRAETGLTWRNQRKVGKLVRRARAMGLISRWTDRGVTDEFR